MAKPEPLSLDRLPHGEPFLLLTSASIDRAASTVYGVRDAGPSDRHANPAGFLPQMLLLELMAQTAGLGLEEGSAGAYVAGFKGLRLGRAARAGERVQVEARLDRRIGPLSLFLCRAEAAGVLLAHGTVILRAL